MDVVNYNPEVGMGAVKYNPEVGMDAVGYIPHDNGCLGWRLNRSNICPRYHND